jgi:hypothetical protein
VKSENTQALQELAVTFSAIIHIIRSYERVALPRADGIAVPVEVQTRVAHFRK